MNILEGIEACFRVFWTKMIILDQEEGQNWSDVRTDVHRNPVGDHN